ncbi:lipopolysaccharide assembly protein LapA domain-containing protein [Oceaniglobus trochenteri]|uniref:lipopolysaccharide assembly protein LapA domain-containing protein n=1 Tax=Oceaniglobus trochenteri TaxID=2763260 RepID=UPI001CFFF241|nr:lipopolysaccharide assembly protein LapA domain-containing protein [Oceaniglobus trochenteri]
MRYIRYAFLIVLAVCLIVVALANREMVTLQLLPVEMAGFLGLSWSVTLPLFLVILGGVVAGVMVGFIWEWLREHKFRAEAVRQRREKEKLEREMKRMAAPSERKGDDVLAILDQPAPAR